MATYKGGCAHVHVTASNPIDNHECHCNVCKSVTKQHTTHVAFAENRCLGCHPEPFSILRPVGRITHAEMDSGRKCGVCHDGKAAHGTQESCDSCHGKGDGS